MNKEDNEQESKQLVIPEWEWRLFIKKYHILTTSKIREYIEKAIKE